MAAIPDARTRCWGQAAKRDSSAAGIVVTAAEACSRDAREVDMAVDALVVAAQPEEEEDEEVLAAGSGAACSASLGQMPCA